MIKQLQTKLKNRIIYRRIEKNYEFVADKGITTQTIDEMEILSKKLAEHDQKWKHYVQNFQKK